MLRIVYTPYLQELSFRCTRTWDRDVISISIILTIPFIISVISQILDLSYSHISRLILRSDFLTCTPSGFLILLPSLSLYLQTPIPLSSGPWDACSDPAYIMSRTFRPHPYLIQTHPLFHSSKHPFVQLSLIHPSLVHFPSVWDFHISSENHTTHLIQKSALSPI